jgi:hypothetical protein
MMVALTGAVRLEPAADRRLASLLVAAGCVVVLLSAPLRMILNQQPAPGTAEVAALHAASVTIAERAAGRPVAFLAYDTLSRHHARFYLTQDGRQPIVEYEPISIRNGDPIDLDQPIRATDTPEALRSRLDRSLRRSADFALVYTDTNRYADPRGTLWPYVLGKPVVDTLLVDLGWKPVAHFTLLERDLVLLENLSARASAPAADIAVAARGGER